MALHPELQKTIDAIFLRPAPRVRLGGCIVCGTTDSDTQGGAPRCRECWRWLNENPMPEWEGE